MEVNYDKNCWGKKPCPKVKCKKDPCCCGLKFVSVPVGLEQEMSPKKGDYSNAIVKYESTGEIYIYSVEGIPVKIKEGE